MMDISAHAATAFGESNPLETPLSMCSAETADCNCPDACERDHGND